MAQERVKGSNSMPRIELTIDNKTNWSTKDLRRFFLAGMKAKGIDTRREIRVRYGNHGGWAVIGGDHVNCYGITVQITLPGPSAVAEKGDGAIDYLKLAQVLEHELDHTLGLNHKDMLDWWTLTPTWHKGLTIEWKEPQKKAALLSAPEKREAHARAMLKKAETRLKRAKTIRDKWSKKVRYYDKKKDS